MSLFNTIANNLNAHPQQAQIVLGLDRNGPNLDNTIKLLSKCGIDCSGRMSADAETEVVLVIRTGVTTCQDAVIKLTESGFKKLQAVYPLKQKS